MLSFLTPSPFAVLDAALTDATLAVPGLTRFDTSQPELRDNGESYMLDVTAPGISPSDLSVEVHENRLSIKGETCTASHTHFVNFSVSLPEDANADATSATSADGILSVTLPKKVTPEARITVMTDSAESEDLPAVDGFHKVVYGPRVLVRASPEADGEIVGVVHQGAVVEGRPTATNPNWIALETGGYMMVEHETYGVLLAPTAPRPYTLTLVAAGLAPTDIVLTAAATLITAKGKTARTGAELDRRLRLPRDADAAAARATCVDGVLTITVPKKAKAALPQSNIVVVNAAAKADAKLHAEAPAHVHDKEDGMIV